MTDKDEKERRDVFESNLELAEQLLNETLELCAGEGFVLNVGQCERRIRVARDFLHDTVLRNRLLQLEKLLEWQRSKPNENETEVEDSDALPNDRATKDGS